MTILHSRVTGSGNRTVVLLGALGSSADMWVALQDTLAQEPYRLIALEHRGHGFSPMPSLQRGAEKADLATRISDLAGDVTDTLRSMNITEQQDPASSARVDLVGLSIGGAVTQVLAASKPTLVRSVTLMCTAPSFGAPSDWTTRATSVRARGSETLRELAEDTVTRWLTANYRDRHPGMTLSIAEMIARTTAAGYAACCDALATFRGEELLGRITAPTLTIAGEQDVTCPPHVLAEINAAVQSPSNNLVFPGAHLLPVESPDRVAGALLDHWSHT